MKCCGSQTISTVPNREPPARAREVASQFNALLIGVAFKPLASAMGFYGELVVASAAQSIAREERGGLSDRLERAIEAAGRSAATVSP